MEQVRRWRAHAEEIRAAAEKYRLKVTKEGMLQAALSYEQFAVDLEYRLRKQHAE